jgi:anti-anti-sigma factor
MTRRPSPFHFTIACNEGRWNVYLCGDFDLARRSAIANLAEVLVECQLPDITFDLRQVTFIDTAGYECIHRAVAIIESSGAEARVVNPSPAVTRLERALQLVAS